MSTDLGVWPGVPHPLGATWDGSWINFTLFSAYAEKLELCLFDDAGRKETARLAPLERTHDIWRASLHTACPGLPRGCRVCGSCEPQAGHSFNLHPLAPAPCRKGPVGRGLRLLRPARAQAVAH